MNPTSPIYSLCPSFTCGLTLKHCLAERASAGALTHTRTHTHTHAHAHTRTHTHARARHSCNRMTIQDGHGQSSAAECSLATRKHEWQSIGTARHARRSPRLCATPPPPTIMAYMHAHAPMRANRNRSCLHRNDLHTHRFLIGRARAHVCECVCVCVCVCVCACARAPERTCDRVSNTLSATLNGQRGSSHE